MYVRCVHVYIALAGGPCHAVLQLANVCACKLHGKLEMLRAQVRRHVAMVSACMYNHYHCSMFVAVHFCCVLC